jgi:hypothetical protein
MVAVGTILAMINEALQVIKPFMWINSALFHTIPTNQSRIFVGYEIEAARNQGL